MRKIQHCIYPLKDEILDYSIWSYKYKHCFDVNSTLKFIARFDLLRREKFIILALIGGSEGSKE